MKYSQTFINFYEIDRKILKFFFAETLHLKNQFDTKNF